MKLTKRQLRRIIREVMEVPMFAVDIRNPGETAYDMGMPFEEYIQLYVDIANEVGVKVVQNAPDLFTVQGPEDAIIAWGSEVNSEEGGPSFNVEEFREYIMREV